MNHVQKALIFSKSAEFGAVKTRLRPLLSDEQCLSLHLALLQDAIQKCLLVDAEPALYLSGNTPLPFLPGIPVRPQGGADLGERMGNAFQEELQNHQRVVIIGTDSPALAPGDISNALAALETNDIVLGPAEDGGYYLIGLSTPIPEIFHGMEWSTSTVLAETLSRLQNRRVHLLPKLADIDQPEDLLGLWNASLPHAPNTDEWLRLNEAVRIRARS